MKDGGEGDGGLEPGDGANACCGDDANAIWGLLGDGGWGRGEDGACVEVVDLDVPRLPVERFVVEEDKLIGFLAFGD